LGVLYSAVKQDSLAEVQLKRIIQLNPDDVSGRFELSRIYLRRQRPQEAIAMLETALRLKPDFQQARDMLASIYRTFNRDSTRTSAR
jgi:predicted Zn-dependent protease